MNLLTLDNDQVTKVVAEAARQVVNGLIRLKKQAGGKLEINVNERVFEFQITIAAPSGVNAIVRTSTHSPTKQTTTTSDPETEEITTTGERRSTSQTTESGRTESTNAQENQSTSENQSQAYGRGTQTDIQYEED